MTVSYCQHGMTQSRIRLKSYTKSKKQKKAKKPREEEEEEEEEETPLLLVPWVFFFLTAGPAAFLNAVFFLDLWSKKAKFEAPFFASEKVGTADFA